MTARSFTALVNPISGRRRAAARWREVSVRLVAAGADVRTVTTRSREDAIAAAQTAAGSGDVVVAVGGDGLVRDVAGGVVRAGGTMAFLPAGRGNDLARRLGVPDDADALAAMLLDGDVRTVDVLEANGVVVPGNVYLGVDSAATRLINRMRRMPALLVYRAAGPLAMLTWRVPTFTVTAAHGRRDVRAHSVIAANSGAYGNGLAIVPTADVEDGLIDLLVVHAGRMSRLSMGAYLAEARTGQHVARDAVEVSRTNEVTIDADRPVPLCADGDEIGTLPVTVRVLPAALSLVLPAEERPAPR